MHQTAVVHEHVRKEWNLLGGHERIVAEYQFANSFGDINQYCWFGSRDIDKGAYPLGRATVTTVCTKNRASGEWVKDTKIFAWWFDYTCTHREEESKGKFYSLQRQSLTEKGATGSEQVAVRLMACNFNFNLLFKFSMALCEFLTHEKTDF